MSALPDPTRGWGHCAHTPDLCTTLVHAQRFLSAHDGINNLFLLRRHQVSATQYRVARTEAFQVWTEVIGVAAAA